ncbi:hypothetical protein ANN_08078 [Periplaneta americana]|uniref:Uncharacterized protein n=1 Tax=Periplaneta americana TaxID=6978 RepID=A0ABQ8T0D4_PERAM|nr:hypothetical protein ANN_08078 [Periplaneta americana]
MRVSRLQHVRNDFIRAEMEAGLRNGHVQRMDEERRPRWIIHCFPTGRRKRGRTRYLNVCPSGCPLDVEALFHFSPYTLQHIKINSLHSFNSPSETGNKLNTGLVYIILDVPPNKKTPRWNENGKGEYSEKNPLQRLFSPTQIPLRLDRGSSPSRLDGRPATTDAAVLHVDNKRRLRWAGHVARMGESINAYRVLVGRPEAKRPLGRPRRRWEDNIKMDLREVGYDDRDWINLAQDRDRWRAYVRAAMNLQRMKKNDAETDQEERDKLVGSLAQKKSTEGCTGSNGEQKKSSGQKKISDETT